MALPQIINPAAPSGSDNPSLGDDELRGIKQFLVDVFGLPNNTLITAAAFTITTAGSVTVNSSLTIPCALFGPPSTILRIESQYSQILFGINGSSLMVIGPTNVAVRFGLGVGLGLTVAATGAFGGSLGVGTLSPTQVSLHVAGQEFVASHLIVGGELRLDTNVSARFVLPVGVSRFAT